MTFTQEKTTFFNGKLASATLKRDRLIRKAIINSFPIFSLNDIYLLLFVFETVWRRQFEVWNKKYQGLELTSENFVPTDALGLSIRQISQHTGLSKSTISRSLSTLTDAGILEYKDKNIVIKRNNLGISVLIERCDSIPKIFNDFEKYVSQILLEDT